MEVIDYNSDFRISNGSHLTPAVQKIRRERYIQNVRHKQYSIWTASKPPGCQEGRYPRLGWTPSVLSIKPMWALKALSYNPSPARHFFKKKKNLCLLAWNQYKWINILFTSMVITMTGSLTGTLSLYLLGVLPPTWEQSKNWFWFTWSHLPDTLPLHPQEGHWEVWFPAHREEGAQIYARHRMVKTWTKAFGGWVKQGFSV